MESKESNLLREGVLLKWTNYLSGWQPRWFRLEGGTLSYYHSQAEVNTCTRGSLQLCFCEMAIHQTDITRFDLIIPGEQYFYLQAPTPQERQLWILAIVRSKTVNQESARILSNKARQETSFRGPASGGDFNATYRELEDKRAELRVYRDSLVCQMNNIRDTLKQDTVPDMEKMNEQTGLVVATCNTFLHALDECMRLSGAGRPSAFNHLNMDIDSSMVQTSSNVETNMPSAAVLTTSVEDSKTSTNSVKEDSVESPASLDLASLSVNDSTTTTTLTQTLKIGNLPPPTGNPIRCRTPANQRVIRTFFSMMSVSFEDICIGSDKTIPTVQFLDACRCFVALFDCFNSSAFAPVKSDMLGNVQFVQQKYFLDPNLFHTLQGIIKKEYSDGVSTELTSATNSLLWLTRGLSYLREFLKEILNAGLHPPTDSIVPYLSVAYERTLRPYHNWVVRGIVALAIRAMPYRSAFLKLLVPDHEDSSSQVKQIQLFEDIEHITAALDILLGIIDRDFEALGLPR